MSTPHALRGAPMEDHSIAVGASNVLPILRRHLRDMAQVIEQSVGSVCLDFNDMARLASANMDSGDEQEGKGSVHHEVERLIETAERILEHMQRRQERSAKLAAQVTQSFESTRQQMHRLRAVMSEVGQIAVGTKLLSVNSRIEAAHLGEHGRAFAIVADEMARLSRYTQLLTGKIETVAVDVGQQLDSIAVELSNVSDEIVDAGSIDHVLSGLRKAHRDMEHALGASASRARQLSEKIASSVMTLQFQDRVGQRIDHVCQALESLETAMLAQATQAEASGGADLERMAQNRERAESLTEAILRQSYTMREERVAHLGLEGAAGAGATPEPDEVASGDVELF